MELESTGIIQPMGSIVNTIWKGCVFEDNGEPVGGGVEVFVLVAGVAVPIEYGMDQARLESDIAERIEAAFEGLDKLPTRPVVEPLGGDKVPPACEN